FYGAADVGRAEKHTDKPISESVRVRASKQWLHRDWDISKVETKALGRWGALGTVDSLCSAKRHIFCDGAVELAPFGRENAVVWFSYTRLPDHATVMQGELRGIEAAANRLTSTQDNPLRQAVIYSDSQAAIRAVT
ncbi:hypothetical protein FOZ61_005313, partial [Perkinsus olseni]